MTDIKAKTIKGEFTGLLQEIVEQLGHSKLKGKVVGLNLNSDTLHVWYRD